jgi:hypothetical protein
VPGFIPGLYSNSFTSPKSSLLLAKNFSKGSKSRLSFFQWCSGAIPNVVPSNRANLFYFYNKFKLESATPRSVNLRSSSDSSGMLAHNSSKVTPKILTPCQRGRNGRKIPYCAWCRWFQAAPHGCVWECHAHDLPTYLKREFRLHVPLC